MTEVTNEVRDESHGLVDEFRSVLDDTLILAIIGDYDLTSQYDEARAQLLGLAADAPAEESSAIDRAHGMSNGDESTESNTASTVDSHNTSGQVSSSAGSIESNGHPGLHATTRGSDVDEIDFAFSDLANRKEEPINEFDEDGASALVSVFPTLKRIDIDFALSKAKGDVVKACEELINIQFLEENGLRAKGIEGAFQLDDYSSNVRAREARPKVGPTQIKVNYNVVHSAASQNNSGPCNTSITRQRVEQPSVAVASSHTVKTISSPISTPLPTPKVGRSQPEWHVVQPKTKTYKELHLEATLAEDASRHSRNAAGDAFKRGTAANNLRAAAGVFSERANEKRAQAQEARSHALAAYVRENSHFNRIDLHGLPVADGIQIAQAQTLAWWKSLGENRVRTAREEGFTIITGLGRHSANGVSQLRQQVPAALKRDGWSVRTETGQFVVTGKQ